MLLESGKIYKRYLANRLNICPSIELKGSVSLYVSDKGQRPSSISEMSLVGDIKQNAINTILAQTRWIAVVYNDDNSLAYEMGIVQSPFISSQTEKKYEPEIVVDSQGTVLLAGPNFYLYW